MKTGIDIEWMAKVLVDHPSDWWVNRERTIIAGADLLDQLMGTNDSLDSVRVRYYRMRPDEQVHWSREIRRLLGHGTKNQHAVDGTVAQPLQGAGSRG